MRYLTEEKIKEYKDNGLKIVHTRIQNEFPCEYIGHVPQHIYFKASIRRPYTFSNMSPTGNCQVFTIGGINAFLYRSRDHDRERKKDLFELLLATNIIIFSKRIITLDINEYNLKKVKRLFRPYAESFGIKRYKSTNGSDMVFCNIKICRKVWDKLYSHYANEYIYGPDKIIDNRIATLKDN